MAHHIVAVCLLDCREVRPLRDLMTVCQESRTTEAKRAYSDVTISGIAAVECDLLPMEAIERFRGDRDFIFGLARGVAVLLSLSTMRRHMTISEVARRTGLSRPTARRCLHTLTRLGFIATDRAGGYSLRPRVLSFSHAYLSASPIAPLAQPLLDALSNATRQACALAVLDGHDITYLVRSMSSPIIAPQLNVGRRQPAYCTSSGHVLLASLSKSQLAKYMAGVRFYQYTAHTINSRAVLRASLERVRTQHFSYVAEQTGLNLCSLAVPICDESGACVAGINIINHGAVQAPEEMIDRYLVALQDTANRLSHVLLCNTFDCMDLSRSPEPPGHDI